MYQCTVPTAARSAHEQSVTHEAEEQYTEHGHTDTRNSCSTHHAPLVFESWEETLSLQLQHSLPYYAAYKA